MINDVILNKISVIERCMKRIYEEYENNPKNLENYTKQDSIVLNLQLACEASIDLAMHIVAQKKLGLPQTSRDAFTLLEQHGIISSSLSQKMKAMVGFRNIAVHDYQELNLTILQKILDNHLTDFTEFTKAIVGQT
ncbi:type VII toxin-antitoxin system HepT family RNase toxin [Anoxybacillus eryuanensis]|uniref:type VII toxin-antitoxin system HepT family RNase toxin n=1 Tax=Anoxybacillus eryuanensis TaxID=651866 RepID=UPI003EF69D4B